MRSVRIVTMTLVLAGLLAAGVSGSVVAADRNTAEAASTQPVAGSTGSRRAILDAESTAPPEVADAIESMVLQWADYWNTSSWMQIHTLWDPDEAAPVYLGEERDRWLIGQEGLASYFNPPKPVRSLMGGVYMLPYRLRVRQVSDTIAIAIWENRLDFNIKNRPPINDNFRVNAILRKKPAGWQFIHYAEAPLAPLSYLEHLYRKDVMPDFDEVAQPMDMME